MDENEGKEEIKVERSRKRKEGETRLMGATGRQQELREKGKRGNLAMKTCRREAGKEEIKVNGKKEDYRKREGNMDGRKKKRGET